MNQDEVLELLEQFPSEAREAYTNGGNWEWKPDSTEFADGWAEWCDDCQRYHLVWYVSGYAVENGVPVKYQWCCYRDGNWSFSDACALTSDVFDAWDERNFGATAEQERRRGWYEYAKHVAETFDDHLGEYGAKPTFRQEWELQVGWRDGQGVVLYTGRPHPEVHVWIPGVECPPEVQQFIASQQELFPTWEYFAEVLRLQTKHQTVDVVVDIDFPNPNYHTELHNIAMRVIAEYEAGDK